MFNGRQYRTRLPCQKTGLNAFHEQVKQNDDISKETMKQNADSKSYVKESKITVGDQIIIKQKKLNKTMPPYNPIPYTVTARNGSQILAKNQRHEVERHVNHCKKLKTETKQEERREQNKSISGSTPRLSTATAKNLLEEEEWQLMEDVENAVGDTPTEEVLDRRSAVEPPNLRPRRAISIPVRYRESSQ